jgi:hypothetical protein
MERIVVAHQDVIVMMSNRLEEKGTRASHAPWFRSVAT